LTNYRAEIANNGRICINEISKWIEERAREYNTAENSIEVPIPYLVGRFDANIEIASFEEKILQNTVRNYTTHANIATFFEESKTSITPGKFSHAQQRFFPHQEIELESITIMQLEKINELQKMGLLCDDAVSQLQFKVADALLEELCEVIKSEDKYNKKMNV